MAEQPPKTAQEKKKTTTRVKDKKEPILLVLIASIVLFLPNAVVALVAATEHGRVPIPSSASMALGVIGVAGFAAFVFAVIALVRCIRQRAAAPLRLFGLPAAVAAFGAIAGLVVPAAAVAAAGDDIARLFPLLLGPALACSSGLLSISAIGLALRSVRRAKERVLDERVITVLLYGSITWLGVSVRNIDAEIMAYSFVACASGLVALAIFAIGRNDESGDDDIAHSNMLRVGDSSTRRRDGRFIVALSLASVVCAIATSWCVHRAQMMATELGSLDDRNLRMTLALDLGQGVLYLLPIAGAAAAAIGRRLTAPLLLLASFGWVLLLVISYPALSPPHTAYDDLKPVGDNYAAVVAMLLAASTWIVTLVRFERVIDPTCPIPSWKIAIAPFVLILIMTFVVQLLSNGQWGYYGDIGEPKHLHDTDGLRLHAFWWAGVIGIFSILLAMVILTLRATGRSLAQAPGWGRADARARIVLVGGWILLAITATVGFATTTKSDGGWVHILMALAPCALAIHLLYLGARTLTAAGEHKKTILDVTLVGLLALVAFGVVHAAVEARLDLSRAIPDPDHSFPHYPPAIWTPVERWMPRLLILPAVGALAVALSSRVRLRALAKHAPALLGVVIIGGGVTMCLFALACAAGIRYQMLPETGPTAPASSSAQQPPPQPKNSGPGSGRF